jgi:gamma-glutamyltranspeptidase/glutathione hydrolase
VIVRDGDRPILAAGASGGRHIMAAVFQLLTYVTDFGMDAEAAAHFPRIDVAGPDAVAADIALGAEIIAALAADAPTATVRRGVMPGNFANPNLIVQHADGSRTGISDDRSPWSAALAEGDPQ